MLDFSTFKNLGTTDDEFLIGFQQSGASSLHLLTSVWPEGDLINVLAIWNNTLYHLAINGTTTVPDVLEHVIDGGNKLQSASASFDVSWSPDLSYYWAVLEADSSSDFDIYFFRAFLTSGQAPDSSGITTFGFFFDIAEIVGIYTAQIDSDSAVFTLMDSENK